MTEITLRTQAWKLDEERPFAFPDGWRVTVYPPRDAPEMDDDAIREVLDMMADMQDECSTADNAAGDT